MESIVKWPKRVALKFESGLNHSQIAVVDWKYTVSIQQFALIDFQFDVIILQSEFPNASFVEW